MVIFQEDDFDEPLVYRPVLKNAGTAVSMSIDLLCRLTNKRNGEQIIREASFNLISPKKYGKKLNVIPLSDEPQSQKVYNKIIKKDLEATNLFIEPTFAPGFETAVDTKVETVVQTEYIPVFFSNNNISISTNSGLAKKSDTDEEVIYGPGKLKFIMSPFDNVVKFKLYNVINNKSVPLDLNINSSKYRITFEVDGGKISIDNQNSQSLENLSNGEISFKIPKEESSKIVKSNSKVFYITSIAQDSTETLMYSGEWRTSKDQRDLDQAAEEAKTQADQIRQSSETISRLEAKINDLENTNKKLKTQKEKYIKIDKVGKAGVVNRFGVSSKIKTNNFNLKNYISRRDQ
jgi:hypothetical protein